MNESDRLAIDMAVESNPAEIAEAEGHLKKGLMILSREMGINITGNIVAEILARLESEIPERRLH
jgi:hypothetical protein